MHSCYVYVISIKSLAEGSKNLTPSNTGTATGTNTFIGYLEHDAAGFSGNFLDASASDEEKVYIHIKNGESRARECHIQSANYCSNVSYRSINFLSQLKN